MKFGSFVLLQCPEWKTEKDAYDEVVEQAVLSEEMGFDSIWLAEHHFSRYSIAADPLVLAAHIAAKTKRIQIGLAVAVLPFHNPVKLAEQAAIVDILSNGRFVMGVGRGYQRQEFDRLNLDIANSRGMFEESLEVLQMAWRGEEFHYDGRFYHVPPTTVYPRPLQKPHPPIAVATSGTRDTMLWVAQHGLPFISGGAFPEMEGVKKRIDTYAEDSRAAGFSDEHIRTALANSPFSRRIYVAENDTDAFERPRQHIMWFHNALMKEGLPASAHREHEGAYKEHLERMRIRATQSYETIWNQDIYATPDKVLRQIQTHAEYGIQNLVLWFNFGGMSREMVTASMARFAKEVMPHVKGR